MRGAGAVAWIIVMMMALPIIAVPASADGGFYRYKSSTDGWTTAAERGQFAIINFDEGQEKMIISVQIDANDLSSDADRAIWIFPIPAAPAKVSLDHLSITPRMTGTPVGQVVTQKVSGDLAWVYCVFGSQLYAIPFAVFWSYAVLYGVGGPGGMGNGSGVRNFGSIERYGVTSEVVSAANSSALNGYLHDQGVDLPASTKSILASYIESNYSFVLSKISDLADFTSQAMKVPQGDTTVYVMGIEVDFPTTDIFFPLKLTSVYESAQIPIVVQVLDDVAPFKYPSTGSNLRMTVEYSYQKDMMIGNDQYFWMYSPYMYLNPTQIWQMKEFFAEQLDASPYSSDWRSRAQAATVLPRDLHYTTIVFNGSASALTEDLWMSDSQPLFVTGSYIDMNTPAVPVIMIFVLISCLSGVIAGALRYRGKREELFFLVGLANLLTILGVWWAFNRIKSEVDDPEKPKKFFVWTYSLIFLMLSGLAYWLVLTAA